MKIFFFFFFFSLLLFFFLFFKALQRRATRKAERIVAEDYDEDDEEMDELCNQSEVNLLYLLHECIGAVIRTHGKKKKLFFSLKMKNRLYLLR